MINQRVLVFDIETAPMIAYVWGRRDINVAVNQIKNDWCVLAWSAKWLGDPASKVIYRDQRHSKHIEDDKAILVPLWKLLDEADIVVTQNGMSFDSRKLNARFILHGMKPPSPYKHLDTFRIAKRVADFTSGSLEYLSDKLCTKYKKLTHSKFPGMALWKECMAGNLAAWNEMRRYNIHDVLSTEELYGKLKAWAPATAPQVYIGTLSCGTCGKDKLVPRGYNYTRVARFRKMCCSSCGTWTLGKREAL